MTFSILLTALLWLTAPVQQSGVPVQLEFSEFFEPGVAELKPSAKLLSLNGQRVRLVGFMARLETPLAGAFYLCSRPVYADESGGGMGDLPMNAVRVFVASAQGTPLKFKAGPLEVTGILEVGNHTEADGTVSALRLLLDPPERQTVKSSSTKLQPKHNLKTRSQRRK